MRVTLERSHLLSSLTHVHRVVERRNTIPILSNVLLRAGEGELKLKATDLDIEAQESVPAMVERPGATTVPAYMFYDIVRKLPDGSQVSLETSADGATLSISSGRSRFSLQMLPESDFPDISAGELTHRFKLEAGALKGLIDKTQFAISNEEIRYYLNGIFLHTVDGPTGTLFRAVATDGHRLARADVPAPAGASGMPGIIVPRKTVGEIQRLIEDPKAELTVELSDAKIRLSLGAVVLTSKLIDGTFPDYARVIPRGNDKQADIDRAVFASAVDRVATISAEKSRSVKLAFDNDRVKLTVRNMEAGQAEEEVEIGYSEEPFEIGFNARYLLDITSQLSSETVVFRLADAGSPTLIQDSGDAATLYVLMPMRV